MNAVVASTLTRLDWDSEHFKKDVYRCNNVDAHPELMKKADLIYQISEEEQLNSLEGFKLGYQGSLCTFEIASTEMPENETIAFRQNAYPPELKDLALSAGIYSRFKQDPRISTRDFEALYCTWWSKCVSGEMADIILAYPPERKSMGIVTLKKSGDYAEIGLLAVDELQRRRGIGLELLRGASDWAARNNCSVLKVRTQGENAASIALYHKFGMTLRKTEFVRHFHKISA